MTKFSENFHNELSIFLGMDLKHIKSIGSKTSFSNKICNEHHLYCLVKKKTDIKFLSTDSSFSSGSLGWKVAVLNFWTSFSSYICKLQAKVIFSGLKQDIKKLPGVFYVGLQYDQMNTMIKTLKPK